MQGQDKQPPRRWEAGVYLPGTQGLPVAFQPSLCPWGPSVAPVGSDAPGPSFWGTTRCLAGRDDVKAHEAWSRGSEQRLLRRPWKTKAAEGLAWWAFPKGTRCALLAEGGVPRAAGPSACLRRRRGGCPPGWMPYLGRHEDAHRPGHVCVVLKRGGIVFPVSI